MIGNSSSINYLKEIVSSDYTETKRNTQVVRRLMEAKGQTRQTT
jgi:hypothetical protein